MMTKTKILKGIEQQLVNFHCWKIDLELDTAIPDTLKQEKVKELKMKYSNLLDIRCKLKELLID